MVKPLNANHGRGVSIRLMDEEQVKVAFATAREHSRAVLVESFLEGLDHRLLVVNGELIAASKRMPGHVGDGERNVEQLVEIVNQDPRRGVGHEKVLTRLEFDDQAERMLAKKGYDKDTVPAEGEIVYLRATANLSTGGTAIDVTDVIHPDNRQMAIRAIRRSASTSAASTSSPPTSPSPTRTSAAASARSTPPRPECTWPPARARRAMRPGR